MHHPPRQPRPPRRNRHPQIRGFSTPITSQNPRHFFAQPRQIRPRWTSNCSHDDRVLHERTPCKTHIAHNHPANITLTIEPASPYRHVPPRRRWTAPAARARNSAAACRLRITANTAHASAPQSSPDMRPKPREPHDARPRRDGSRPGRRLQLQWSPPRLIAAHKEAATTSASEVRKPTATRPSGVSHISANRTTDRARRM